MDKLVRSRRGGPRTFKRDDAIETAMRLFWRHGYEGVSVSDLTEAIGIAAPSLYSAFGSKAGLYREALDRYRSLPGALDSLALASNLDEAIVGLLGAAVRAATTSPAERGCMVSSGLLQCAIEHDILARELSARRRSMQDAIALAFSRWLDRAQADALASYLATVLQGLSVQARDGASRRVLQHVADEVIAGIRARPIGQGHKRAQSLLSGQSSRRASAT
jgi:AcrR family transcriptional regulator